MAWKPQTISELKRLCAEGLSYAEIGTRLGVTKNAVLGKASRLGIGNGNPVYRMRVGAPPKRAAVKPPVPAPVIPPPRRDASGVFYTTLTVRAGMCRWIYEAKRETEHYCAHEAGAGTSWCPAHRALVFTRNAKADLEPAQERKAA